MHHSVTLQYSGYNALLYSSPRFALCAGTRSSTFVNNTAIIMQEILLASVDLHTDAL